MLDDGQNFPGFAPDVVTNGGIGAASQTPRQSSARQAVASLDSSRIQIGDAIVLQTTSEAPKLSARLIGYLKNRSVITTQPEIDGELVMLREGQAFTVRFFSGKSVCEFATNILKQTSVPYPLVHLAYPRELKVQEVRRSARIAVDLIAAIEFSGQAGQSSGKLIDLGAHGAGLCAKTALGQKGDFLRLKFKLSIQGVDSYLVLNSEIRNVLKREGDHAMPYLHGLNFSGVESNSQLALSAYVYGRLLGDM